jgi:DNA-binding SARP family transcriptional activator
MIAGPDQRILHPQSTALNLMLRLRLLGGFTLERDGIPTSGRATQRRRVALLALLAAAPAQSVARDRIISLLWPEAETESARHLLAGAVYDLRKALSQEALVSQGDDLRLDPSVVHTDVTAFQEALAAGDLSSAVTLYAGPFGDGLHLSGALEFDRWLEVTRNRLAGEFRTAAEALASQRAEAGDHRGAAALWHRIVALEPSDGRAVAALMRALIATGHPAGALRQARLHATLMREEYGVPVDSAVTVLEAEISRGAPTASEHGSRAVSSGAREDADTVQFASRDDAHPDARSGSHWGAHSRSHALSPPPSPRRRGWMLGIAAVGAVLLLASGVLHRASGRATHVAAVERIIVLPFASQEARGDSLGRTMADLLTTSLDGVASLRVMPSAPASSVTNAGAGAGAVDA